MTASTRTRLAPGSYYGRSFSRIAAPSFEFARLTATVAEREVPRHTHEAPHFVLVLEGLYTTQARGADALCPPGTLIYNPGGVTHRDRFATQRGRFLAISPAPGMWAMLERAPAVPIVVSHPLARFVRAAAAVAGLTHASGVEDCEALGLELAVGISNPAAHSHHPPAWLARAREFMDDAAESPTVAQIAQAAGVHPVALARAFRRWFQSTPGEYLRRAKIVRLRAAIERGLPLADAALTCGFADQSQMTRAFTRAFTLSPGRYRRLAAGFQNDKTETSAGCHDDA